MRKFRQTPATLRTEVTGELVRNAQGRMRIGHFDVTIKLPDAVDKLQHFDHCLQQFEDFCVVTESVRHGIPVNVRIVDNDGREVFSGREPRTMP